MDDQTQPNTQPPQPVVVTHRNVGRGKTILLLVVGLLLVASFAGNVLMYLDRQAPDSSSKKTDTKSTQPITKIDNAADQAPAGFVKYEDANTGVSFYWPKIWGDKANVSSGLVSSYVVKLAYTNDLKYSEEQGFWVYANNAIDKTKTVGDTAYSDVASSSVLLKNKDLTVYDFGFGDAECGSEKPTLVNNGYVVQINIPISCTEVDKQGNETGQVSLTVNNQKVFLDAKQNRANTRTLIDSITLK
ncbi:MAG: hypothetical protein Q7T74_05875 [Candidatus Saccharibacteria bacterium]|nr:hypothetical protein [Candidatus Saccharibacteria bacterium]